MRRIATVTNCVPLASCACCITSTEGYLPVPTMSREVNSYLPIFKTSFMCCPIRLPARDGADDLDAVALVYALVLERRAAHDLVVFGDGDAALGRLQMREQLRDRQPL